MAEPTQSESDIKLSWEIRKLQAEVEALNRPLKNPSVIAALTTATLVAIVSCGGLLIQWLRSDRDYTLAQIKAERLHVEAEKLQAESAKLQADSKKLQIESAKLQVESQKLQADRAALDSEVAARRSELKTVLQELKEVRETLAITPGSDAQRQKVIENLDSATEALSRQASELEASMYKVHYLVDTYKNLERLGIIKRKGVLGGWTISLTSVRDGVFVDVSRLSLSEIIIPASPADVSVLTAHGSGSWRIVPIASDKTKFQIIEPDKFWSAGRYLVLAMKER